DGPDALPDVCADLDRSGLGHLDPAAVAGELDTGVGVGDGQPATGAGGDVVVGDYLFEVAGKAGQPRPVARVEYAAVGGDGHVRSGGNLGADFPDAGAEPGRFRLGLGLRLRHRIRLRRVAVACRYRDDG